VKSLTVDKSSGAVAPGTPLAELAGCALTGTIVHAGSGRGAVVATRARTEFGAIATGLDTRQVDTGPQLLPAVVSTRLAAGSRRMRARKVLVKRLVCIEDLGDGDLLFTHKNRNSHRGPTRVHAGRGRGRGPALGAARHRRRGWGKSAGPRAVGVARRGRGAGGGGWVYAGAALRRPGGLGIAVKVVTGDNAAVAVTVCKELGLPDVTALTAAELDGLDDAALAAAIPRTTDFARASPEHKARIVRVRRGVGAGGVAFLGDGVNNALALHAADVGISVDSATDVAKDAADVILLDKDLDVLVDGVIEGRRIFANTLKYVLMGTPSNFGNTFSAAGASLVLSFLPMLSSQILLYDTSQLAIPNDNVDEEQLRRPSHWDIVFIRRFMLVLAR
jgi:magnesium-transporting ATPase (P-type)